MTAQIYAVAELAEVANCLRLVGHPNRLAIVFYLLRGPCLVSELEEALGLHQPNLSQHLSILRDANILSSQRQAKAVLYELKEGVPKGIILSIYSQMAGARDVADAGGSSSPEVLRPVSKGGGVEWAGRREGEDASLFAHVLTPERG